VSVPQGSAGAARLREEFSALRSIAAVCSELHSQAAGANVVPGVRRRSEDRLEQQECCRHVADARQIDDAIEIQLKCGRHSQDRFGWSREFRSHQGREALHCAAPFAIELAQRDSKVDGNGRVFLAPDVAALQDGALTRAMERRRSIALERRNRGKNDRLDPERDHSAIELAAVDFPDSGKAPRDEVVLAKAARHVEVP
jgi:hypothetical protein